MTLPDPPFPLPAALREMIEGARSRESKTYFQPKEVEGLDPRLVDLLNDLRHLCDFPLIISKNGGLRPEDKDSAHSRGLAVDVKISASWQRYRVAMAAMLLGVKRLGLYDQHVHIDLAGEPFPQYVLWTGESK